MILLVDIGNTRVKWRLLDKALKFIGCGALVNDELNLEYISSNFDNMTISHIYIANVASDSMSVWFEDLAHEKRAKLRKLSSQAAMLNIKLKYKNINNLGVDRSLALVGAFEGEGMLVIDAGSAITADYLNGKGEYLGGYIVPGLEMSRNLLISKTAKVGVFADIGADQPGLSTNECVNNGVVVMFRALVSGFISVAEAKGIDKFVITGGDGELFQMWSDDRLEYCDNLVLDGLAKYCLSESKFFLESQ